MPKNTPEEADLAPSYEVRPRKETFGVFRTVDGELVSAVPSVEVGEDYIRRLEEGGLGAALDAEARKAAVKGEKSAQTGTKTPKSASAASQGPSSGSEGL